MAENITFENSAGPVGQALAIRVDGDRAVFRNCRFLGWQDTLFLNRGRQYFEDCYIQGHVDFIFGAATAFFERCHIHCLRNGYIAAASTYDYYPYGFVFSNCKITGEPDVKTYLGRPWRDFANTIYLDTECQTSCVRKDGRTGIYRSARRLLVTLSSIAKGQVQIRKPESRGRNS